MKPEQILKSHVLDIVFENRNKTYGAYELRKFYNNRLLRSIGFTILIVIIFAALQSWKTPHRFGFIPAQLEGVKLTAYEVPKEIPKEKEQPKPIMHHKENIATVANVVPKIVPDKDANKDVPDVAKIDSSLIDTKDAKGSAVTTEVGVTAGPSTNTAIAGTGNNNNVIENISEIKVWDRAEFMPEFPGGKDAYVKFMRKNLREPNDLEDGQKIVVMAKFIVQTDGSISDFNIVQDGRKDLNEEVLRVLRKMPKWKPGMQNGRAVPVYFRVPVTFMSAE